MCRLVSVHSNRRRDVGQTVYVSVWVRLSALLRASLRPGLTSCYRIQDSCCLDTFRQKLDPTRETHVFVCHDNSHSSSAVFVDLPSLSFKDKASTFSTVPPANRRFWTLYPTVSAGLSHAGFSALMSFPLQEKMG